ncbi:MAG: flagellar motor switch protein FliM [Candidatus Neomarinimicrobiota bacterium]|nr:MAG: flagellar motor switch protein FliM [Candidatus Neomarinimicrobiota bacterium]
MAKILSQEEIDALISNIATNPEKTPSPDKKIAVYDFKQPHLISKEQMRLLESIHEDLARNFSVFLSAQLRMIVDMNLMGVDQIMYSEFMMSISNPGVIYIGNFDNPASKFILEMDPRLAIFTVERIFGGVGSYTSSIRPISLIEQRVMNRVVHRLAGEITKNWSSYIDLNTTFERYESNPEFVQIIPASEAVVVVSMEIKIHENSSIINLCYPYLWISSVMSRPEVQSKIQFGTQQSTEEDRNLITQNLNTTPVDLRVLVGKTRVPMKSLLELEEGDVIVTTTRLIDDVPVYAGNEPVFQGVIGKKNSNYAFMIKDFKQEEKNHDF